MLKILINYKDNDKRNTLANKLIKLGGFDFEFKNNELTIYVKSVNDLEFLLPELE